MQSVRYLYSTSLGCKKGKIKQFKYKNIWFLEIGSFLSTILSVSPRFPRNVKEICICQCINSRICVQTPSKRLKSTFVVTNVFKKSVFNAWKNIHEDPFYVTKRRQMLVQKFVIFFFLKNEAVVSVFLLTKKSLLFMRKSTEGTIAGTSTTSKIYPLQLETNFWPMSLP